MPSVSDDLCRDSNWILKHHQTIHILTIHNKWCWNLNSYGPILKARNIYKMNKVIHLFNPDPYTVIIIMQISYLCVIVSTAADKKCLRMAQAVSCKRHWFKIRRLTGIFCIGRQTIDSAEVPLVVLLVLV